MSRETPSIGESESGAFELGSVQQERENMRAELEGLEKRLEDPGLRPDQLKALGEEIQIKRQLLKLLNPGNKPEQLDPKKTVH